MRSKCSKSFIQDLDSYLDLLVLKTQSCNMSKLVSNFANTENNGFDTSICRLEDLLMNSDDMLSDMLIQARDILGRDLLYLYKNHKDIEVLHITLPANIANLMGKVTTALIKKILEHPRFTVPTDMPERIKLLANTITSVSKSERKRLQK